MATKRASPRLENLERMIDNKGGVTVAVIESYGCVAAASESTGSVAMLLRRPREPLIDLLQRLDAAVVTAYASGARVDEVNVSPDTTLPGKKKSRR